MNRPPPSRFAPISVAPTRADSHADSHEAGASDPHDPFVASLVGTRVGGRYDIVRVLARGGMGAVFEAVYADLDQHVALKVMFPELVSNPVLHRRFAREAKLAAKVRSPHLVRVSDVGRLESGVPYLVMELLSGRDLDSELAHRGPLPVGEALDYVLQAICGVAELHALGVVHRDLKPSNLFLADVAGVPTVKILDFGISKEGSVASGSLTTTENLLGTPAYMSPEQIKASKAVDFRSDIWALGVITYELLTGHLPFEGRCDSVGEILAQVLTGQLVPLRQRRFGLPMELEGVVMKCIRKNPDERYGDVAELASALQPFAVGPSLHRIEVVRRALGKEDGAIELAAPRPQPVRELRARSSTAVASRSLVSATKAIPALDRARGPSYRPLILAGLGAVTLLAVGTAGARAMRDGAVAGVTGVGAPAVGASALVAPNDGDEAAPVRLAPSADPTALLSTRAAAMFGPDVNPAASASAAHGASKRAPRSALAAPRPAAPEAAGPPAAGSSAGAAARSAAPIRNEDLILDRK